MASIDSLLGPVDERAGVDDDDVGVLARRPPAHAPRACSWPSMTSPSTRFLGQPRLTRPTRQRLAGRRGAIGGPAASKRQRAPSLPAAFPVSFSSDASVSGGSRSVRLFRRVDLVAPLAELVAVAGGVELVADVGHLVADPAQDLVLLALLGDQGEVVRDRRPAAARPCPGRKAGPRPAPPAPCGSARRATSVPCRLRL